MIQTHSHSHKDAVEHEFTIEERKKISKEGI